MRTGTLMLVIAFLCVLLALPFQLRTPQGELYRKRANSFDKRATEFRLAEQRARAKGNEDQAEQFRLQAERLSQQGWIYRKGSYRHWKWPELKPPWSPRISY
jgi:hypothetical protein